jgi:exopolysaccharide biosynthesis polyprenyl glycosylphosphotransferase
MGAASWLTRGRTGALLGVALSHVAMLVVLAGFFYVNFSVRFGRGIMAVGGALSFLLVLLHHLRLRRLEGIYAPERVGLLLTSALDVATARHLTEQCPEGIQVVGQFTTSDETPRGTWPVLGPAERMIELAAEHRLSRVVCSWDAVHLPALRDRVCTLRYAGVPVVSLLSWCEELLQAIPLHLVTPEWLLNASGAPQMSYLQKMKRISDIAASMVVLLVLGPVMLLGMLAVRLSSPGPVIYRQRRSGQRGEDFELLKLRTMRVDAEQHGAVWSSAHDPRVTAVGRFLRKYRIDEIPQVINVLRGDMSFVGPRPERPEFVAQLAAQIPYFKERLMVRPGITGWAQVNYPYGASVEDAQRKLEYDLYYLKNMGLLLDVFILLDTVRTVLCGSVWANSRPHLLAAMPPGAPTPSALPLASDRRPTAER